MVNLTGPSDRASDHTHYFKSLVGHSGGQRTSDNEPQMTINENRSIETKSSATNRVSTDELSPAGPRLGCVKRSEFTFLSFLTLFLCVVTALPHMVGHIVHIPGTVFTDVLVQSYDSNNYLAYARQAASGKWLFHNPMTSEPHLAVFFNLEWLLVGKISSSLRISLAAGLEVLRMICLALMCFGVYWLSSFLFTDRLTRRIVAVATLAGGGFGWLATLHLLHIPIDSSLFLDLTNANLFPFYWALKVPHFLVSESLLVLGFCFFLRGENTCRVHNYILAAIFYSASGACRPYDMLFAVTATALFIVVSRLRKPHQLTYLNQRSIPIVICLPLLCYYYWIFKIHPMFRSWSLYGNAAPPAWLLLLGFGLIVLFLPLSIRGLYHAELSDAAVFILCCLITAVVFIYTHRVLHFAFQFATNIYIPLVMIVMLGLHAAVSPGKRTSRWRTAVIVSTLGVNSLTSLALTSQAVLLAAHGDFRVNAGLLQSFSWLDTHSHADDSVLADFDMSNNMPQYTHNVVYCGYPSAVDFANKVDNQRAFFDVRTPNEFRRKLMEENSIRFVLVSSGEEREIPALKQLPFLKEVFRNDAAVVFAVQPVR